MPFETLEDIAKLCALDAAARGRIAEELAKKLGKGWSAATPEPIDGLLLSHAPTKLTFVAVPGGAFDMGLTNADVEAVKKEIGWNSEIEGALATVRKETTPVRQVQVRPFLVARSTLPAKEVERLSKKKHSGKYVHVLLREEARDLARALGFRLASEAELQWIARDGGTTSFVLDSAAKLESADHDAEQIPSRFGLRGVFGQQWAEDDYHPDYECAPMTSEAWLAGEPCGVGTGYTTPELVDAQHQKLGLLACLRTNRGHQKAKVRFALDLP